MYHSLRSILLFSFVSLCFMACNRGPKVINSTQSSQQSQEAVKSSGIFSTAARSSEGGLMPSIPPVAQTSTSTNEFHTVVVDEVLPTPRYVYLHVHEGEEKFWIATRKQEIQKGGTYYYRDGLLKTNFESKEYDRIFDKIYLVSKLVGQNHAGGNGSQLPHNHEETAHDHSDHSSPPQKIIKEGSIKISDIVSNPGKYEGKTVQISGKCIKVNPNIMNRHWIHLQDGSKDDFDLVVTTNEVVREGDIVTMRATVGLNVDFGAGYKYDLILENGAVLR